METDRERSTFMLGHLQSPTLLAEWYFIYYVPFLVYISPWESHKQRSSCGLEKELISIMRFLGQMPIS